MALDIDGIKRVTRTSRAATERVKSGDTAAKGAEQSQAASGASATTKPSSTKPRGESALSQASEGQKETTPARRRTVRSSGTSVANATQADIDAKKDAGEDVGARQVKLEEAKKQADLRIEMAANDAADGKPSAGGDTVDDEKKYAETRGLRFASDLDDTEKVIVAEQLEEERRQMRGATDELLTKRVPERSDAEDHPEVDFDGMTADERALLYQSVINERTLLDAERALIADQDEGGDGEWDANIDTDKVDIDGDPDNGPDIEGLTDEDIAAQQAMLQQEQQYLWDLSEQVAGTFTDEELDQLRTSGSIAVITDTACELVPVSDEWVDALEQARDESSYRPEESVADKDKPAGAYGTEEYRAAQVEARGNGADATDGTDGTEATDEADGTGTDDETSSDAPAIEAVGIDENGTPGDWSDDTHIVSIDGTQVEIPESSFDPETATGWVDGIPYEGTTGTYAAQVHYTVDEANDGLLSYEILATALTIPTEEELDPGSGANAGPDADANDAPASDEAPAENSAPAPSPTPTGGGSNSGLGTPSPAPAPSNPYDSYDMGSTGASTPLGVGGESATAPVEPLPLAPIGSGEAIEPLRTIDPVVDGGVGSVVFQLGTQEASIADYQFAPDPELDDVAYASFQLDGRTFVVARYGTGTEDDPFTYELHDAEALDSEADLDAILLLIREHEQERLENVDYNLAPRGSTGPDQAVAGLQEDLPLQ